MIAPIKTCDYCCAVGMMPTFMDGETVCYDCLSTLPKTMREARSEIVSLRTKIAEMEKQEPVGWLLDGDFYEARQMSLYKDNEPLPGQTALYALPGAQPASSVPDGFSREDLEAVADGLDGYEKMVNVGNVTSGGDDHLESTTAYAARFIRAMLAKAPETKP